MAIQPIRFERQENSVIDPNQAIMWRALEDQRFCREYILQQQNYTNKRDLLETRLEKESANRERMFLWKLARDAADYGIGLDSHDCVLIEQSVSDPNGRDKRIFRTPLGKVAHLKMIRVSSVTNKMGFPEFFILKWGKSEGFILARNTEIPQHEVFRKLLRAGVISNVFQKKRPLIESALFAYLLEHSESLALPDRFGWYRDLKGDWRFCHEDDPSIERIKEEEDKNG